MQAIKIMHALSACSVILEEVAEEASVCTSGPKSLSAILSPSTGEGATALTLNSLGESASATSPSSRKLLGPEASTGEAAVVFLIAGSASAGDSAATVVFADDGRTR